MGERNGFGDTAQQLYEEHINRRHVTTAHVAAVMHTLMLDSPPPLQRAHDIAGSSCRRETQRWHRTCESSAMLTAELKGTEVRRRTQEERMSAGESNSWLVIAPHGRARTGMVPHARAETGKALERVNKLGVDSNVESVVDVAPCERRRDETT